MKLNNFFIAIVALILASCDTQPQQESESNDLSTEALETTTEDDDVVLEKKNETEPFDISTIPVTHEDLGDFPYFSAPKRTSYINRGGTLLEFDQTFVAINGAFIPVEGPSFRAYIHADGDKEWSAFYVERSYEDKILSVGGVKVSDQPIAEDEVERVGTDKLKSGHEGSFDFWNNDPIKTYVIRKDDGREVYVQLQVNSASGSIQIAQKGDFEQTIELIKAEDIKEQLDENGKAVLYINFDTDKSTLKSDGEQVVTEISKVLTEDKTLKLSVEGHTDNTGDAAHNLKLSKERAESVLNELIAMGVDRSRLQSDGFGAEKPLVANDTEENKAKNRRIELVKI